MTFYQSGGNPPPSLARFFSSWALLEVMASLRQGSLQVIYLNCYIFWESLNENCKAILTKTIHILHHHFDGYPPICTMHITHQPPSTPAPDPSHRTHQQTWRRLHLTAHAGQPEHQCLMVHRRVDIPLRFQFETLFLSYR